MDRGGEFLRGGGVGKGGEGASRQGEEDPGVDGETGLRGALRVTSESAGNGGGGGSTPAATATIEAGQSRRGGRAADRQGSAGQKVSPKRAIVAVVSRVAKVGVPRERGRRGVAVVRAVAVAEGIRGRRRLVSRRRRAVSRRRRAVSRRRRAQGTRRQRRRRSVQSKRRLDVRSQT